MNSIQRCRCISNLPQRNQAWRRSFESWHKLFFIDLLLLECVLWGVAEASWFKNLWATGSFIYISFYKRTNLCHTNLLLANGIRCSLYLEPDLEDHLSDASGWKRQLKLDDLQELVNQSLPPYILMGDINAMHTLWGDSVCDRCGNINLLIDDDHFTHEWWLLSKVWCASYLVSHRLNICSRVLRLDYQWSVDKDTLGSDNLLFI